MEFEASCAHFYTTQLWWTILTFQRKGKGIIVCRVGLGAGLLGKVLPSCSVFEELLSFSSNRPNVRPSQNSAVLRPMAQQTDISNYFFLYTANGGGILSTLWQTKQTRKNGQQSPAFWWRCLFCSRNEKFCFQELKINFIGCNLL